ncbi:MAG TPA: thermonuclease family protein [Nitrospinota bacterium]|nr:thermonuclease family protein [Nitrospinota bacterium]
MNSIHKFILLFIFFVPSFIPLKGEAKPLFHYIKPVSAICTRAIDGDTIIVNIAGAKARVRLIGVDTPETKHPRKPVQYFGKEASMFTANMVEGKKVRLEFDQNQRDRYKRLLAYVYLEDGTFLNAEIVKQGYGHAYTKFPFKYMQEFRIYEREARIRKRGLWK